MQGKPTLLLIRSHPDSVRVAELFQNKLETVISPVLQIVPTQTDINFDNYNQFIFTSKNGVETLSNRIDLKGRSGFAVGKRTAEFARALGMDIQSSDGDVASLIRLIAREKPAGRLLHVRGKHSTGNLTEALITHELDTDSVVIYDQTEREITTRAKTLLETSCDVVLPIFSPRTAQIFSKQAAGLKIKARIHVVAISAKALDRYSGPTLRTSIVAKAPDAASVFKEIDKLLCTAP